MPTISQYVLLCPECGMIPTRKLTGYGVRSECCGLWSWDGKPLVDKATHKARAAAHTALDPLWQHDHMSRTEAYRRLAEIMGMTAKECHISLMDAATAERVPDAVKQIRVEADRE